jgi:hypothetical protein
MSMNASPRQAGRLERPRTWEPAVLAVLIAVLNVPLLGGSPQNPDGAEMILAAAPGGGVLHPPGFPLQSWLDRVVIHLPVGNPALRLSLLSWLAHSAAAAVLGWVLLALGYGRSALWFGVAVFAFSQATWSLAVQPEKYALTELLLALALLQAVRFCARRPQLSTVDALACGSLVGLCLAQHTITVFYAPAFLVSAYCLLGSAKGRVVRLTAAAGACALVGAGLYLSLLLESRGATWPDWGKIATVHDVVNHVQRADFHIVQPIDKRVAIRGLRVLGSQAFGTWSVACLLPALGVVGLWRSGRRRELFAIGGSFAGAIGFLYLVQFGTAGWVAWTYLERYTVVALVAGAVLAAAGLELLLSFTPARWKWLVRLAAAGSVVVAVCFGWAAADARRDPTLDVFRTGLQISIDDDDVWVAATDIELFYGIPSAGGSRFPIIAGYAWTPRALRTLEPRLANGPMYRDELVRMAYRRGLRVVGVTPDSLSASPGPVRSRGLVWVTDPAPGPASGLDPARRAGRLCDAIRMLRPLPKAGHFYSRYLWQWFPAAYEGAAQALEELGDAQGAELSNRVARALEEGRDPARWVDACRDFASHLAQKYPEAPVRE